MDKRLNKFLEPELSYKLVGCFYEVRNKYGKFHNERVYDKALSEILEINGLKFIDKPKIPIYSVDTGKELTFYIPDKLVGNKIIVELKAKIFVPKYEFEKAVEYLKVSEYEILYFVNFKEQMFKPQRVVYSNCLKKFISLINSKSDLRKSAIDLR